MRFSYAFAPHIGDPSDNELRSDSAVEENDCLQTIERELRDEISKQGPLPSWLGSLGTGLRPSTLWLVKGVPWLEVNTLNNSLLLDLMTTQDMNRYPSPILKLVFEGPDVQEEVLYELCRVSHLLGTVEVSSH